MRPAREIDVGDAARRVAEQVREALQRPLVLPDTEIYTSASVGISLYPGDASDAESLLKHADIAMYKAKESGRDGYQLFSASGHDHAHSCRWPDGCGGRSSGTS